MSLKNQTNNNNNYDNLLDTEKNTHQNSSVKPYSSFKTHHSINNMKSKKQKLFKKTQILY